MIRTLPSALACALVALSGCSPGGDGQGGAPGTTAASTSGSSSSVWNAADACRTLDKAAVAQALGTAVRSAELSRVTAATASTAGVSQCTYGLADGRNVDFFARQSPISDNTPEAIEMALNSAAVFSPVSPENIPGVGKSAFWVPTLGQLQFFIGEDRYGFITIPGADKVKTREAAITLARRIAS